MADTIDLIDSDGGEEEELADDEEETDVDDEDKAVKEGEEDEGDEEEELKEGEEDEDDEDCELMESEYADFGLIVDERKDRDTSSASSSFSSVPSTSVSSPSSSSSLHPTPHSSSISSSPSVPSSSVPSASLSSSSSSSSSSTLHQELQQQQVQADERLAHNLFLHENPHLLQPPAAAPASSSSSSSPPFAASSSHPHPGWISSHPDDPSNNPPLRARLIAQHHEHLNSSSPFVDVHSLFLLYAHLFFFNQLQAVSVRWSKRMTSCAGLCRAFDVQRGGCEIALSEALLKFRSKKEVVETLLHEMIHAYLFVSHLHKHDHDDHGPYFCRYMEQINAALGLSISVYHTFFQEVKHFKVHVWQCQGRCRLWKPYHGKVARVANRKPSLADKWVSASTRCPPFVQSLHRLPLLCLTALIPLCCASPAVRTTPDQLWRRVRQGGRPQRGGDEGGQEGASEAPEAGEEGGEGEQGQAGREEQGPQAGRQADGPARLAHTQQAGQGGGGGGGVEDWGEGEGRQDGHGEG